MLPLSAPAAPRGPRRLRRRIVRRRGQWAGAGHNRVRRDEAPQPRVVVARMMLQQPRPVQPLAGVIQRGLRHAAASDGTPRGERLPRDRAAHRCSDVHEDAPRTFVRQACVARCAGERSAVARSAAGGRFVEHILDVTATRRGQRRHLLSRVTHASSALWVGCPASTLVPRLHPAS